MQHLTLLIIFISVIFSQGLVFNENIIHIEIESINNNNIDNALSMSPYFQFHSNKKFNLLDSFSNNIILSPVIGIKYSDISFEIHPNELSHNSKWITTGYSFEYIKPIVNPFSNIWIYAWSNFHFHHIFGVDHSDYSNPEDMLFQYNSNYFLTYRGVSSIEVDDYGAIEFDNTTGGVSFISDNSQIIVGKFASKAGPFYTSNLSISTQAPDFMQINYKYNYKKFTFRFIAGQLESLVSQDTSIGDNGNLNKVHNIQRYLFMHRLDYKVNNNLRVGIYEMVITGGDVFNMNYFNPMALYWSVEHTGYDKDNILIGIDLDLIYKYNRIYGSMIIDEWRPESTTDSEESRNWVGLQFGFSRLLSIFSFPLLFKIEFAHLEPQLYEHYLVRNEAKHHNYPIGFWSGGHSQDISTYLFINLNEKKKISLSYTLTKKGESKWEHGIDFNPNLWERNMMQIKYQQEIFLPNLTFDLSGKYITSKGIYEENSIFGLEFGFLYNINY